MDRSSGILMSISSLPSPYGIGTFGKAAYDFADFLYSSGQKYWQMLPLGPTSYGDSPYQSFSSFAGNPYFIDLDMLIEDGLLEKSDLEGIDFGTDPRYVDYAKIYESRFRLLEIAKKNDWSNNIDAINSFINENQWVNDYALYMACKRHFGMKSWIEWNDELLRYREPNTLSQYRSALNDDVELFIYIQFLFYKQWDALKEYIHSLGIKTIGDVPIYVPLDSADVWCEPQFFQLDEGYLPEDVAGVPPDYFSADGQLWGNPLYNWDRMRDDGYGWWIRRIGGASKLFDMIRIDHFRGFSEYWAVPYGEKTAKNGRWKKGPAMDLVGRLSGWFRDTAFIAEDLGTPTEPLKELLKESGWPGMKVLEFAFDSEEESDFLPHTYIKNCICYTGTHDNATLQEWFDEAKEKDQNFAMTYLGNMRKDQFVWNTIRAGQASVADLFIAQIQDYLKLGKGNRMNVPSTLGGNWTWRLLPNELDEKLSAKISDISKLYGRKPPISVEDAKKIAEAEALKKLEEEKAKLEAEIAAKKTEA